MRFPMLAVAALLAVAACGSSTAPIATPRINFIIPKTNPTLLAAYADADSCARDGQASLPEDYFVYVFLSPGFGPTTESAQMADTIFVAAATGYDQTVFARALIKAAFHRDPAVWFTCHKGSGARTKIDR